MFFFEEITSYINFGPEDSARLRELYPHVEPHLPHIIKDFYDALWAQTPTRQILATPELVASLSSKLDGWFRELFLGPHDANYYERRRKIGLVHVRVGLRPQYMFGAMNVVRRSIISRLFQPPDDCASPGVGSLEKILDIDLSVMLHAYWDEIIRSKMQVPAALAAGLAHEIRNPLNAVGLHLTLLERHLRRLGDEAEAANASIEVIRHELRRMRTLTTEIVDFAKPLELSCSWIDPQEFLRRLEQTHAPSLLASGIQLHLHVEGVRRLWCDRDHLQSALVNLMMNAVEAMDGPGQLTLAIRREDRAAVITVQDTGAGIPREALPQVFDLFFTTKAAGTGIGLAAVLKVVEAHQGSVALDSEPGCTNIRIRIPQPADFAELTAEIAPRPG